MGLKHYIILLRPPLLILGFLASVALLKWSNNLYDIPKSILIILAIGFGNAAFTTLNELKDVEVDRINKPWKPLPSGKVSKKSAQITIYASLILSVICLILLSVYNLFYLIIGILGLIGGYVYNAVRKDLIGNLFMGLTYGSAAAMSLYPKYLPFSIAFGAFTIAFNLLVQHQDLIAEKTAGVVTAPQQLGRDVTRYVSATLSLISYLIYYYLWYVTGYAPLLLLQLTAILPIFSAMYPESVVIETINRRITRLFLILGFLWMVIS